MSYANSALIVAVSAFILVGCGRAPIRTQPEQPTPPDQPSSNLPVDTKERVKAQPPLVKPSDLASPVTQPGTNTQGAATLEFQKRVQAYVRIHNDAARKVSALKRTDDPGEISAREKALAVMIMTDRAGAQIGDIFAPQYQSFFVRIVQDDFAARSASDRKALIWELPRDMKVDINTVYPQRIPLATFPASLLAKLPDLPPELEYRIVGRSLILRDVKANLIVDILRDVVPTIPS
jgi:hypothetical protein